MNDAQFAKIREYTCKLIEGMDDGTIDPRAVADMALAYMSEDSVKDMCLSNDYFVDNSDEEVDPEYDESMDGDFDSGMASAGFGTDEDYGYYGE